MRQRLRGDVDEDAEREHRIRLQGPLPAEGERAPQRSRIQVGCAAVEVEQRLVDRDERASGWFDARKLLQPIETTASSAKPTALGWVMRIMM